MAKVAIFNEQQAEVLELARREGGVFLKLYQDKTKPVDIISCDEKGDFFLLFALDKVISKKIYDLHAKDVLYKAPLEAGAYMISLAWFIVECC